MINFDILNDKKIKEIIRDFEKNYNQRNDYEFNIFSISKYGKQLENFHSDIIAELINPFGKHNEGNLLLNTFIEFLNLNGANIKTNFLNNVEIKREKDRIDIAIYNDRNEVIIIENKINGAVDANKQLERYYKSQIERNYNVVCVVYLTLSGEKKAPSIPNSNVKPINITAFSNNEKDLVNAWLYPSIGKCKNFDTTSFLKQYTKLLISLSYNKMNSKLYEKFYNLADNMTLVKDINALKQIADELPKIRMDKFVQNLPNFQPFSKSYRYKPYYMLYDNFNENDNSFKLDVWFEANGNARIHFWNPAKKGDEAFESVKNKIKEINYENILFPSKENWIGYFKVFEFDKYKSLKQLDDDLLKFVKEFMTILDKTKKQ